MDHSLFQLLDNGDEVAGFERLDDHSIRLHAVGIFSPIGFQLADRQQHWSFQSINRGAYLLADLKAGVPRHVDIQDDDVRFMLRNFFYRGSAIAYSDDIIARIGKDLLTHVLGCHAVISE